MGKKAASTLINLLRKQIDELRFELQKAQQDAYFWRGAAITMGIFAITLILYIWGKQH